MTNSRSFQTIFFGLALTAIGSLIAFWTGWMIIIPVFFSLSFPIVNIEKPFRQKFTRTLIIAASLTAILIATGLLFVGISLDKYIFPGILFGIASVLILIINNLLIEATKLDIKAVLITFILSGLSLPTFIFFGGRIFGDSLSDIDTRLYGIINFCLAITTITVSFGLRKKPTANSGQLRQPDENSIP